MTKHILQNDRVEYVAVPKLGMKITSIQFLLLRKAVNMQRKQIYRCCNCLKEFVTECRNYRDFSDREEYVACPFCNAHLVPEYDYMLIARMANLGFIIIGLGAVSTGLASMVWGFDSIGKKVGLIFLLLYVCSAIFYEIAEIGIADKVLGTRILK